MGLDTYLRASKYVCGYDFKGNDGKKEYTGLLKLAGLTREDLAVADTPSGSLEVTVGYWRKANQIHAWFVKNVQKGVDDCGDYRVDREQLVELRDLCVELLKDKDPEKAKVALPPQPGFFFGDYEINDWYWADLDETVKQLNAILTNPKFENWDFEYHSSW